MYSIQWPVYSRGQVAKVSRAGGWTGGRDSQDGVESRELWVATVAGVHWPDLAADSGGRHTAHTPPRTVPLSQQLCVNRPDTSKQVTTVNS